MASSSMTPLVFRSITRSRVPLSRTLSLLPQASTPSTSFSSSSFSRLQQSPSSSSCSYSTSSPPSQHPVFPKVTDAPLPTPEKPMFPAPINPFDPANQNPVKRQHSDLKVKVVKALAGMMGYNSTTSTTIRETMGMCEAIVDGVQLSKDFWYTECNLPATYQTFFQLHLLYLLILLTRLRSLPATSAGIITQSTIAQAYQTELLTHFFSLAEVQMRVTLGQTERETVVRKYMKEMGEQWKGAGIGFDYVMAISGSTSSSSTPTPVVEAEPASEEAAVSQLDVNPDAELAAWVWRNLFAGRGSNPNQSSQPFSGSATPSPPGAEPLSPEETLSEKVEDLKMVVNLEKIVRFIRREMHRLETLDDAEVLKGKVGWFGEVA